MKYVCSVCGYIYDEAREKVPFSELPQSWKCPVCKAAKAVFAAEKKKEPEALTPQALAEEPVLGEKGMVKLFCRNAWRPVLQSGAGLREAVQATGGGAVS